MYQHPLGRLLIYTDKETKEEFCLPEEIWNELFTLFVSTKYDVLDKMLYGRVEGVNDPIQFESTSSKNIEKEFRKAVDEYLDFCMTTGKEPEKEYTGSFNVRIGKKLHKELALQALKSQISLNAAVIEAIEMYLEHSL